MNFSTQPMPYIEVDYVALGLAQTREESTRFNTARRVGFEAAAMMRLSNPVFATLPMCFQPLIGALAAANAEPNNLFVATPSDGSRHLLGTVRRPDGPGWRIFHMVIAAGKNSDLDVMAVNLPVRPFSNEVDFPTLDVAETVLNAIVQASSLDPDVLLAIQQTMH